MATKKKAAVKKPRAPRKPQATAQPNHLADVRRIADSPNSPKGAIDELRNYLSGKASVKALEAVNNLVNDAHTDGETLYNVRTYLSSQKA